MHQKKHGEIILPDKNVDSGYKNLFKKSSAVMMLIDPKDGKIIDANAAACSFYGWSLDTLRSMQISQINILPENLTKIEMNKALTGKKNFFLFKHRRASGNPVHVEVYCGSIAFNGQDVIYSIVHDITKRIDSIRALKESEQRFRNLIEGAPDAIFIQTQGRFVFVNQTALDLFGAQSKKQLIGHALLERVHPDYKDVVTERIKALDEEKTVVPLEQIYIKLNGDPVYVDITSVFIVYKNKNSSVSFVRDITARKNLQKQKLNIEAQLRQQQKLEAIGTLAGGVAHEINNPINGIMNYAQLILESLDQDSENALYAREIIHETDRVANIVKNLLQFSRFEKQAHSYARIEDIINRTVVLIKTIIKKDQIDLKIELEQDLPDIKCRSQQIQQVLMNLLINAKDALNSKYFGYHQDKIIFVHSYLYMEEDQHWIRTTVEDRGGGIPTRLQEKIFEPFFSTKPKEVGTGLGLAISFGIMQDHRGRLSFETQKEQYTRFHLDLPVDNGWTIGN